MPLECETFPIFLSLVLGDRLRNGIPIGLIAAAASAGALVGLGLRHDAATIAFEMGGRALFDTWRLAAPPTVLALAAGVLAHLMWMTLWGICFSVVSERLGGLSLPAAALVFVLFLGAAASTVIPGALGAIAFAALTTQQTAFFLLVLAGAFMAGALLTRARR